LEKSDRLLGPKLQDKAMCNASHYSRYAPLYRHLHENLRADLKVSDLARLMQMTPDHLTRLFKADTGISLKHYLVQQLLQRASGLLVFDNLRIKEIADSLKFRNIAEFTRFFARSAGISPSAYRATHRRD
jgi:AraC-like DNA-binding protein